MRKFGVFFAALLLACASRAQTPATSVPLVLPSAIAFDSAGNLYLAERGAHIIRKVAPDGTITTIAGTGTQGFSGDNGPAVSATLDSPSGLAVDALGNLFLADTHNHRIRRIAASTAIITTVAGTGAPGFSGDNGPATSAALDTPTALAVDTSGNLFFADTRNHRIRRISASTGTITTIAGSGRQGFSGDNGPAISAAIDSPSGLAVDTSGNLFLADTRNHRVRRIAASTGVITTLAGTGPTPGLPAISGDNGPASSATLALPRGLTIDPSGNLYLADTANHRIRRIDAGTGTITSVAGDGTQAFSGDNAAASAAALNSPSAVALSPSSSLILADSANARVRQLDSSSNIRTIAGLTTALSTPALTLAGPASLTYGSGTLTATLASAPTATGTVTFVDRTAATPITLATAPLTSGTATLDTSPLAAATHSILATYSGDTSHTTAQSQALAITIAPLPITAAGQSASILYGQPIPTLTGTLTGVLSRDTSNLTAAFTTSAAVLSPAATYPLAATLSGPAASNYTLAATTGSLSISKAPTATTITISSTSPLTLTIQTASSTTGTPTGSVAILDGASTLTQTTLSSGTATYTSAALSSGPHSLTAAYLGDTNFLPSTSQPAVISTGSPADFTLTPATASTQSIPSGSTASYSFSLASTGTPLTSPIALTVTGLPTGATSSFNPAYIPPGGAVTAFTLSVLTTKTAQASAQAVPPTGKSPFRGPLLSLSALALTPVVFRSKRKLYPQLRRNLLTRVAVLTVSCIVLCTLATGCGNRVNTAGGVQTAPTYSLTVTGTATSASGTLLQHSVTVTLQVL